MRLLFFCLFVVLVASSSLNGDDGELSDVSKRSPINLYRPALLKEDRERAAEDAENQDILTARQLIRGPRFLFWRFSLSTATNFFATVTSTSTTTCTLSVSSICSGRRKRSSTLEEEGEDVIAPSNVLPVESTPAADFESARQSRKADPFYHHRNRLYPGIQSGMVMERPNRHYYSNYYDDNHYNNNPYYDDDYYIPAHPGRRYELFNQRRRPQLQQQQHIPFDETDLLDNEEPSSEAASFKLLFNSFSNLFSTFTLTLTTTTGTSTSFTRVTVTSTPACSTPGVFAQCPTG